MTKFEVDFYYGDVYDPKRYDYTQRLFAYRDGRPYRVSLARLKELYGMGPDEMSGTAHMMSESDWRYLCPVASEPAPFPDETMHYKCIL
tara:strand:- start:1622 stop:1888 length:267 start_codon:yes stop_codon:yes gene_type:complete